MTKITNYHSKHLKQVYGETIFTDENFFMNYGWATDDNSITTKIYKKGGNEFLTTFYDGGYKFECGKL